MSYDPIEDGEEFTAVMIMAPNCLSTQQHTDRILARIASAGVSYIVSRDSKNGASSYY